MGNILQPQANRVPDNSKRIGYEPPAIATRFLSPDEMRLLGEMSPSRDYDSTTWTRAKVMDIAGSKKQISLRPCKIDIYPHMGDYFYQKSDHVYPVRTISFADQFAPGRLIPQVSSHPTQLVKSNRVSRIMGNVTVPQ